MISLQTIFGTISDWNPDSTTEIFLDTLLSIFLVSVACLWLRWVFSLTLSHLESRQPPKPIQYLDNVFGRFVEFAPAFLVSVGILGTFLGVSIGLAKFDYTDTAAIDRSIPLLLGGLKMAFMTSIAGMFLSLTFRFMLNFRGGGEAQTTEEVSGNDLFYELREQTELLEKLYKDVKRNADLSEKTRQAIAGDADSSLVTQLQKLRTDVRDQSEATRKQTADSLGKLRHDLRDESLAMRDHLTKKIATPLLDTIDELKDQMADFGEQVRGDFRDFANKIAELGSKQLIEALQEVIRDFNEKLTEQFGENFKQLNTAVGRLVEWQENYRQQLEKMKEGFDLAVSAIDHSKDAVASIEEHSREIPNAMEKLKTIVETVQVQLDDMEDHLDAFAELRDKAINAMPEIKTQLDEIMGTISKSIYTASQQYGDLLKQAHDFVANFKTETTDLAGQIHDQVKEATKQIVTGSQEAQETLKQGAQNVVDGANSLKGSMDGVITQIGNVISNADDVAQKFGTKLEEHTTQVFNEQNNRVQQLSGSLRKELDEAHSRRMDSINKDLQAIDEAMQKEITRTMQIMADQLGRITGQFTQDYSQLTENMGKVVNEAQRFQATRAAS